MVFFICFFFFKMANEAITYEPRTQIVEIFKIYLLKETLKRCLNNV